MNKKEFLYGNVERIVTHRISCPNCGEEFESFDGESTRHFIEDLMDQFYEQGNEIVCYMCMEDEENGVTNDCQ